MYWTGFLEQINMNRDNGFSLGKVFGSRSQLGLRIPKDRQKNFIRAILALSRAQE